MATATVRIYKSLPCLQHGSQKKKGKSGTYNINILLPFVEKEIKNSEFWLTIIIVVSIIRYDMQSLYGFYRKNSL